MRIDSGAVICHDVLLSPIVDRHELTIKPIHIGRNATIGDRSVVLGGVIVGEGARIEPMSFVPENTVIPPGEVWGGAPAHRISTAIFT